jgi:putative addiction module component
MREQHAELGPATYGYQFTLAMTLSPEVRAELAERLIDTVAEDVSPDIAEAQLAEVKPRIAEYSPRSRTDSR